MRTSCPVRRRPAPLGRLFDPGTALTLGALAVPTLLGLASARLAQAQRPAPRPLLRPPADAAPAADGAADASAARPRNCPAGMRLIDGDYCPNVEQTCLRWLDPPPGDQMRCAEFAPTRCLSTRRPHISVCMDEFEYPNRRGAYPQVMVNWYAAQRTCEARGARLCNMAEWTFACEGEQMLPYPYGLSRDTTACNLDHQTRRPDRARLGNPASSADEAARLYEAVPSGTYEHCVSSFGIHDMTGNVDEWTENETGLPYHSALKGGWWGPIRGRCRPATVSHNEGFVYYQIGFRCCANPR